MARGRKQGRVHTPASASSRRVLPRSVALAAGMLFACVFPVLLIAHPISYVPLISVIVLVCVSWVYLRVLRRTFSFDETQMRASCERGSDVGLTVFLSNASALPHPYVDIEFYISDLFGDYDAKQHITATLGAHEKRSLSLDARFVHLGRYNAGIDAIVLHDLLGLFKVRIENPARRHVVVRPKMFDFYQAEVSEASDQEQQALLKAIASDNADYSSVREYRYGDPLKTVHWNLTARSASHTMYTRLYEVYVSPSLSIVIDPFSANTDPETLMSLFDALLEGATSLSHAVRQAGVECTIRYLDRSFEPATACLASDDDTDQLVLNALRITSLASRSVEESIPVMMLRNEGIGARGAGTVAFVTSRIDERILTALEDVTANRRRAFLLLAVPAALAGRDRVRFLAPLQRLGTIGIPTYLLEAGERETRVVTS